jgi:hypothetical protein
MKEEKQICGGPNEFLDFSKFKVQDITMDKLRRSYHERIPGQVAPNGIYHDEFITQVQEICTEAGLHPQVMDLFAAQNHQGLMSGVATVEELTKQYGEFGVEATTLRRVFCNIRLTDFDTNEFTTNISIAYHQRGIQVGFGNNVIICHNQCMLGADQYVASYGDGRRKSDKKIEEILNIIKGWLFNANERVMAERTIIKHMMRIPVSPEELTTIIGMLTIKRVQCDTLHPEIRDTAECYPLSNTQINTFVENLLLKKIAKDAYGDGLTVWDIYNAATECYKAKGMDIPKILPQNISMVNFLNNLYNLRGDIAEPIMVKNNTLERTFEEAVVIPA